jgi:uncharacterized flavoprotein (TIGR03862 family)
MKAAPLLRHWVRRLKANEVEFHVGKSLVDLACGGDGVSLFFADGHLVRADAAILALGGASWSRTGSDGQWVEWLGRHGVEIHSLTQANCGWEVAWSDDFARTCEGQPLKNLELTAGQHSVRGELMITRYGLEGGGLYQLTPALREMDQPCLQIDFKPEVPIEVLMRKLESVRRDFLEAARRRLRLSPAAVALLKDHGGPIDSIPALCRAVRSLAIPLERPRPIDEAISSAGGVAWHELDDGLMIRRLPGVFVCGEMIDWEAPTGGYLIQGCFATATHAANAALRLDKNGRSTGTA